MEATLTIEIIRHDGTAEQVEATPEEFKQLKTDFAEFIASSGEAPRTFTGERFATRFGEARTIKQVGT